MPCPFLSRLPSAYVRNYGLNILKSFGNHCPVVSRLATSIPSDANMQIMDSPPSTTKCPFLAEVSVPVVQEASEELRGDVIQFPLENSREEECARKVDDIAIDGVSPDKSSQQNKGGGICLTFCMLLTLTLSIMWLLYV